MENDGVPSHDARIAFAEADTQPFRVVRRRDRHRLPVGFSARIGIATVGVVVLVAFIVLGAIIIDAPHTSAVREPEGASLAETSTMSPTTVRRLPQPTITSTATVRPPIPTPAATTSAPISTATTAATVEPSETPSPVPTKTATATPTTASAAERVEDETGEIIELVKNGGFEDGDEHWYLEGGARSAGVNAKSGQRALILPARQGYADQHLPLVPGTTYKLVASGRLGADGDIGEIRVSFSGSNVPADSDEPTLLFTKTTYMQHVITFTVPEGVEEAKLLVWKNEGAGIFAVDAISLTEASD